VQGNPRCRSQQCLVRQEASWAAEWGGASSELRGPNQLHRGVAQGDAFMCGSRPQTGACSSYLKQVAPPHKPPLDEVKPLQVGRTI
jgi:hypothetical protein